MSEVNHLPTLSVLLPCHNEAARLPRQLAAIMSQLLDTDELVLLDDGSTDGTSKILDEFKGLPNVRHARNDKASGVVAAYNRCGEMASRVWVLGASGNDEVSPGAFEAWRDAARKWPCCRIIFGRVTPTAPLPWDIEPRLYLRHQMPDLWRLHMGHRSHGAGAFIRRDVWGKGYTAGGYMADWWQAWQIAARYGCGYIPKVISTLSQAGVSAAHNDDKVYNAMMAEIHDEINSDECNDIRDQIAALNETCDFLSPREQMIWFERGRKSFIG